MLAPGAGLHTPPEPGLSTWHSPAASSPKISSFEWRPRYAPPLRIKQEMADVGIGILFGCVK